ncbi:hypothetical protein C8J56DRAFT_1136358 [Mycena floridula]|nr:hypothetical protein C8J56DRAFT_1136358 [Mycena floridula]
MFSALQPNNSQGTSSALQDHPIFSSSSSLELSTATLSRFTQSSPTEDAHNLSGRLQVMVLKDSDLLVACGQEIRMASVSESRKSEKQSYKVLHTPNIEFDIHQMVLNPTGKFLAVAGAFQVAVVTLPSESHTRLVPKTADCKSFQVGQFYHATKSSPPIAKIEWHPWGVGGSTLMVMTVDGKLREYDIAEDPEEPQQVLSFIPDRKPGKSFLAEDPSEREVASFTLGKGRGDWGPLTVFAVMKSGDIYSICPYMPQNASIPSAYVHSLECFIASKQEFLSQGNTSSTSKHLSTIYEYQHKYVAALLKQMPPGTVFPSVSRSVTMHPPRTIKSHPIRQGPFLLQPSPRNLDESDGGYATDITYLAFSTDEEDDETDSEGAQTEHLGVVLVAFQDGRVDNALPMLAVYETIDLGLVSSLAGLSVRPGEVSPMSLLQGNHPVLLVDPIHDDTIYVYHAFGVYVLRLGAVLQGLATALKSEEDDAGAALEATLRTPTETAVQSILSTFSVERRCSNPVIAVALPDDVYLNYSICILTSAMRISSFSLNVRSASPPPTSEKILPKNDNTLLPLPGPPVYASLLTDKPFVPAPVLASRSGLPSNPRLSLPASSSFMLTPDTMRYLGKTVAQLSGQIRDVQLAHRASEARTILQLQELQRQCQKCREMYLLVEKLKGPRREGTEARLKRIQETETALLARLDKILQLMLQKSSPELSDNETKWFEELKRLKEEVLGAGRYDEGSLWQLEREYDRLLPTLKTIVEKENQKKLKLADSTQTLGFSQVFELGERSNFERERLSEMQSQISKLAEQLNVTLARPGK